MTIKTGDKLPDATFKVIGPEGPSDLSVKDVFGGKKVALFGVPAAFSPTCHKQHLPGFVGRFGDLKAKGIDTVACVSVNDMFVMNVWSSQVDPDGKILMLADGNGDFTKAIGMDIDLTGFGMGTRSKRFAMLVNDGVVKTVNVEDSPPEHDKTSADTVCSLIDRSL